MAAFYPNSDGAPEPNGESELLEAGGSEAPVGTGERFKALKSKLASKGASNPGALAAYIGRKKYGASKFAKLGAKGKKR